MEIHTIHVEDLEVSLIMMLMMMTGYLIMLLLIFLVGAFGTMKG
jgi:hypothetical protein